jgi:biotin carboxyl carrier protein
MSTENMAERAIADARALLATLTASEWREIHVASGGTEIFIAKPGGRQNPMRVAATVPAPSPESSAIPVVTVTAPHVASLHSVKAAGARVEEGDRIAVLRVLDEHHDLLAPTAGAVTAAFAAPGDLVEFGQPVLTLSAAG